MKGGRECTSGLIAGDVFATLLFSCWIIDMLLWGASASSAGSRGCPFPKSGNMVVPKPCERV